MKRRSAIQRTLRRLGRQTEAILVWARARTTRRAAVIGAASVVVVGVVAVTATMSDFGAPGTACLEGTLLTASQEKLTASAEAGEADAMYCLGLIHQRGIGGREADLSTGRTWLEKAAAAGSVHAKLHLGLMYRQGLAATPRDRETALRWLVEAGEAGSCRGLFEAGRLLRNALRDPDAARGEYLLAKAFSAARNPTAGAEAEAHYVLGSAYRSGIGVERDKKAAAKHFRIAARLGHPEGMLRLGKAQLFGEGIPQNSDEAMKWLRKAASLGSSEAALTLAKALQERASYRFPGVRSDPAKENEWKRAAVGFRDGSVLCNLVITGRDELEKCLELGDEEWESISRQASQWAKASPDFDDPEALCYLATLMGSGNGIGLHSDRVEEARLLRLAAEGSSSWGMFRWAGVLSTGEGTAANPEEAFRWAQRAAEEGEELAMVLLGCWFAEGAGHDADPEQAERWVRTAGERGLLAGMEMLIFMNAKGLLVPQNDNQAIKWAERAFGPDHASFRRADALTAIGKLFWNDERFADDDEAVRWFDLAAKAGHAEGTSHLAWASRVGRGTELDLTRSLELYRKASSLGYGRATYRVAWFHSTGQVVPQDTVEARKVLAKGVEQHDARCMVALAVMLRNGRGGEVNLERANALLREADATGDPQYQTFLAQEARLPEWSGIAFSPDREAAAWQQWQQEWERRQWLNDMIGARNRGEQAYW